MFKNSSSAVPVLSRVQARREAQRVVAEAKMRPPFLAKPLWADGRDGSHGLAVIHDEAGLAQLVEGRGPLAFPAARHAAAVCGARRLPVQGAVPLMTGGPRVVRFLIPAGGGSRAARVPAVRHAAAVCGARRLPVPGALLRGLCRPFSRAGLHVIRFAAAVHRAKEVPV